MIRHLRCSGWSIAAALLVAGLSAYAQDQAAPSMSVSASPSTDLELMLRTASTFGLPGIVAAIAWQLRGLLASGIIVRLSDEDRELLRHPKPDR